MNLQNIGLIATNESQYKEDEGDFDDIYIDKLIYFKTNVKNKNGSLVEFYSLTRAGLELSQHLNVDLNQKYIDVLKQKYGSDYTIEIS